MMFRLSVDTTLLQKVIRKVLGTNSFDTPTIKYALIDHPVYAMLHNIKENSDQKTGRSSKYVSTQCLAVLFLQVYLNQMTHIMMTNF